ncbi:MAG TPA: hypothetical protein VEK79_11205 [Thermoanaerobaculia bacterium]|nr:hypothetical protein [Thermoanaerobaculia bacterium]
MFLAGAASGQSVDLRVTNLFDSIDPITLGTGDVAYSATIFNGSATAGTNPVVTFTLPAASTFVSASANLSGTCNAPSGGTLTCTWAGSFAASNTRTATITVTPTAGGSMSVTASVTGDQPDPTPSNNSLTESTTVNAQIDLKISSLFDSIDPITLGTGNVTYTAQMFNESTSKATNPFVTITLPASSTFVSATANLSGTCTAPSGGVLTCNWTGDFPASNTRTATVTVTPTAGGTMTLTATAGADQSDPDPADNTASHNTAVNAQIDLKVSSLFDSIDPVTLGTGDVTYTAQIFNESSSKATNPFVTVTLPASSTFVSASANLSGTCGAPSGGVLTCNWTGDFPASNTRTANITVSPTAGGTMTLSVTAGADQSDPDPADNTASHNTTVNAQIDLKVSSLFDSIDPVTLGTGDVTYTATVFNESSSKATNPFVTFTLPASSTFVSASANLSGTCGAPSGGVLTCNWTGDLPASNTRTATVTVTPTAGGTMTLTATAGADQSDPDPGDNTASHNTTVNAQIDLRVSSLFDSIDPITLGTGNVTYTAQIFNAGTSKATNTFVTITLPASSTFVSASANVSGTCTAPSGGVLTCNWAGDLAASNTRTATITVTPTAGGTITLTAVAGGDQPDPNNADNTVSHNTTVNDQIDLRVSSLFDSIDPITLGTGNVTYTAQIFNASSSKATNAFVTITLPPSSTFVSASANVSGTCTAPSGGVLTCNWAGDLAASNTRTASITITPTAGGTMTLTAVAGGDQPDPNTADNTVSHNTAVNDQIDLRVSSLFDSIDPVTLGTGNVTYTAQIFNASTSKATNAFVTFTLPASSTFVSSTANVGGTCTAPSGGVLTCTWAGDLAASNTRTATISVTPTVGGTMTLTAVAGGDQPDPNTADNTASHNTTVNAQIDLRISSLFDSIDPITLGTGNVTYTAQVFNASSSKATNAFVTFTLPASSTFVSSTANVGGTCTAPSGGVMTCTWAGDLAASNTRTATVTVTPTGGGTMTLTTTAGGDQPDPNTSDNTASQSTTVNATLDLQLSISDSPDPRIVGAGNVTYTFNLLNAGSSKVTNPVLTFTMAPSTTFVSGTASSGGTCGHSAGTVTCNWTGDFNASTGRTATVIVTPTVVGQISATGTVNADQGDPAPANNTETETTNIYPATAPTITGFTPISGPVGTVVTISGSSFFSTSSVSFTGAGATFTVVNDTTITTTVPVGAATGKITVLNTIGSTLSAANFTVTPAPDLTISKTASAATVPVSSPYNYTLAVNNGGAGSANDVTVTDTLPLGVTLTTAAGTGWTCSGTTTVTCTMGALAPGAAPSITLNVTAPATGTTVNNIANVSTTTPETSTGNNSGSVAVGIVGCPTTPVVTAPATVCANSTNHTASTPLVPGGTYAWSITNGTITSSTTSNIITFDANSSGQVQLDVAVFVSSCPSALNTAFVNISVPTATITPSGPTTFCSGGGVMLTANAGSSYLWSTGATTQSINVNTAGSYTVAVTNADGCTTTSAATNVSVLPPPTATITPSGPTTFCDGGSVTLSAPAGMTNYSWSNGATSQSINVTDSGTFTVTITNPSGCSATSAPVSVTELAPLVATITPSGPTTFCSGGSVTLDAGAGFTSYLWSNGATSQSINVAASGTFTVTVTDANTCSATSAPTVVTMNPNPTVTVSGPSTACGSAVLDAGPGFATYNWSNGATTQTTTVTTTGGYFVTVTDANGCSATSSPKSVTINSAPGVNIAGPLSACDSANLDAGAGFVSYLWNTGAISQSINVTTSGVYTVTVTDANGCTGTDTHTITIDATPAATITPSGPTTFCAGGSVTLTSSPAASYLWSNGATTQSIVVTASETFTVTTSNGACSATSAPTVVTVSPGATVDITGPAATCAGAAVTLDAGANFASYLWSTGATTQTITVTPSTLTTYTVNVTNASGCSASDTHTVNVTANPAATINAPATVCSLATNATASVAPQTGATYAWTIANGTITSANNTPSITFTAGASGSVTLDVTVTNGSCVSTGSSVIPIGALTVNITGPADSCPGDPFTLSVPAAFASYLWSNGATTPSMTAAAPGTYSVTVTDATGCTASASHTVAPLTAPLATISAPASAPADSAGHIASVPLFAGAATYAWSIANGTITGGQGTTVITFQTGSSGTTTLGVVIVGNGCSSSDNVAVAITEAGPGSADLSISKTAPSSVQAGAPFAYTLVVTNNGPDTAGDVTIEDVLPAGVTLSSMNDSVFTCIPSGLPIHCTGGLAAGSSRMITFNVLAPPTTGTITNTATIAGGPGDENDANNTSSASTNIVAAPPSCSTVPPSLIAPANNATVPSPVTFTWNPVSGATEYELWIESSLAGTTNATSLTLPLPSGAATWHVVARLAESCTPLVSAERTLFVATSSTCDNGRPQLLAPTAGSTQTSPVSFQWTSVANAIGYRLWIESNGTAAQDVGTTTGTTLTGNIEPGSAIAYVDALFSGCGPTRSDAIPFNVPAPDPCAARATATPISPNNAILSSSLVTFQWHAAAGSAGYRVWAAIDGAAPVVIGTTEGTSLQAFIEDGDVLWFVESLYEGCPSTESQRFHFTIPPAQQCGTSPLPNLAQPVNDSTTQDGEIDFRWTNVPNAIAYELWLGFADAAPALVTTTSATEHTHIVAPGTYDWFVRAIMNRCPSRDSQTRTFTFTPPPACTANQRPTAIEPLPGATHTPAVAFSWGAVPNATHYELFIDGAAVTNTSTTQATRTLLTGPHRWFVRAHFANCAPLDSAAQPINVVQPPQACAPLRAPAISAPGQISSGVELRVQWSPSPGATAYQVQFASTSDFLDAEVIVTNATQHSLLRVNDGTTPLSIFARVRAIDARCKPTPSVSPFGPTSVLHILPASAEASVPLTNNDVATFTVPIGAEFAGQSFTATVKETWLTVTPSSGIVPAGGTTLTAQANTSVLGVGTHLGAVFLTFESAGSIRTNATTLKVPTISISKVTPVTPSPKSTPPPDALIIPAVAHASGINSQFQSDVRVTNSSAELLQYQLTFTPTGTDGLASARQTTFSIDPGRTIALDDILRTMFGTGGDSVTGTLEVRPMTENDSTTTSDSSLFGGALADLVTFASSRTFNVTSNGTFGQYIPAVPYANFVGMSPTVLSLQQIAQSDRYRTNLGIVEASGSPAELLVKVFGSDGQFLKEFPVNLAGGEHTQLNGFISTQGIGTLSDGRVEISVIGGTGKVTAYASVLDNATNDPLLVTPVALNDAGDTKWVVPGVADLNNGFANWQTDMRLFNAGSTDVDALLTFHSQGGGTPKTQSVTIPAGQVRQFDKALASVFGSAGDGGAIHISTPSATRLVATARTYNETSGGTYGQFISGITPNEATGTDSRPLQILQVEESNRFRSNIGLAEVTGKPVTLELSIIPPDGKFIAVTEVELQANEFRQINSLLRTVGLADTFNARVSVRAIEGEGRVTAYASVIDMLTNDPTYVPAQ